MPSYCIKTNRPSTWCSLFYKSKHPRILAYLLQLHCEAHCSAGIKIIQQVTEILWDKYFRWCEWKQEERYKGYNHSPHEIKSQVLYSLHTLRSYESWFKGLSYQQESITPQWFSSTWKAEHHSEWQEMRSSNHTHNPFSSYSMHCTVTAKASVITQRCRRTKLSVSSGCQHPFLTQLLDMLLL